MKTHQVHFDRKFYQDKRTGYWISTDYPRERAHIYVWKQYHGKIPKGFHIHHKDGDKSNNSIENLAIISASEHTSLHMQDPVKRKRASDMANKYRHLTKEWHSSPEGRAWHKAHGILTWLERQSFTKPCKECGKKFETKTYHQDFCSNSCKSKNRRKSRIDDEERNCIICNNLFKINKYSKTKCCSRKCANNLRLI